MVYRLLLRESRPWKPIVSYMRSFKPQNENPLVSVIILNYNGKEFLKACLDSVLGSDYPNLEVIFVDNGSTDHSVDFVNKTYGNDPRLKVVRNVRNLGFAEGNNAGARKARGEFLVFLNNDTRVHPNWLKELVKTCLSDEGVGIAICRIITPSSPTGSLVGNIDKYGNGISIPLEKAPGNEVIASGPAFMIRHHIWNKAGGFDSRYFIYVEDIDLAWRVKLLGYKIVVSFNSIVYHKAERTTRRLDLLRKRYFVYRNSIRTLLKNYSALTWIKIIPVYLLLSAVQSIALTFVARRNVLLSLFKAVTWNMVYLKDTLVIHNVVQRRRVLSDGEIQRFMCKLQPHQLLPIARARRNLGRVIR